MTRSTDASSLETNLRQALRSQLADLVGSMPVDNVFRPSVLRWARRVGLRAEPARLLRRWATQETGSRHSDRRYPWDLPTNLAGLDTLPDEAWFWRPLEVDLARKDPAAYAQRFLVPVVLADTFEYLEELSEANSRRADDVATTILLGATPTLDDDLATFVLKRDAWRDTFALWLLTRRPYTLERHHQLLLALGARYAIAARMTAGIVSGTTYPFYNAELVSASAQLATGLLILGIYPSLLPTLVSFVRDEQRRDGGWGDPGQPSDILTTLAAADLLAHVDPDFSTDRVVRFIAKQRQSDGWWRAYGPESPWLATELDLLLDELAIPFVERFRWPHVVSWNRDRHTGAASFAHLEDLIRFFADLDILREEILEVAYLDLAGFGRWNTEYGMDAGDDVLRLLAECLAAIPGSRVIRDGGDEFILIGAPRKVGLPEDIDAFRFAWPAQFRKRFGPTSVVVPPRILSMTVPASNLKLARYHLSRALGAAKERYAKPPPEGIHERFGPTAT